MEFFVSHQADGEGIALNLFLGILLDQLTVVDRTFCDGFQEVRIARTTQTAVGVEVGDDPRRVFLRLLVEVTTVVGNFVGKVGVGAEREGRDMSFDWVARISGETMVHVSELTLTL